MNSSKSKQVKTGFIEGLNPLVKLIVLIVLVAVLLFIPLSDWVKNYSILISVLLFIAFSKNRKKIIKRSLLFSPMILVITFMTPFKGDGGSWISFYGVSIYKTGMINFVSLIAKMFSILLFANLFALTTSILGLIGTLKSVRVPDKLLSILFLVNRFIALFQKDIFERGRALKSRQIKLPKLIFLKYLVNFLVTIFLDLFEKNERIFNSLYSRGFVGKITSRSELSWEAKDFISLMIFLMLVLIVVMV